TLSEHFQRSGEISSREIHVVLNSISFRKVKDKYYLVNKGFPNRDGYLVPYPRLRYHKRQFQHKPPQNERETFGVKQRWKILTKMPQFITETQIQIVVATFALHNYTRINSPDDPLF
ncbi:hypothetical protein RDABS01_001882, partial [Bienertia sinuspersici]